MYANLFLPFPIPSLSAEETVKKSKKGKGKAAVVEVSENDVASGTKSCWSGLGPSEISSVATSVALSGHLGYNVVACTVSPELSQSCHPSPFVNGVPYPQVDPRTVSSSRASSSAVPDLVQVSRLHLVMDNSGKHPFIPMNHSALQQYDLISVMPLTREAMPGVVALTAPGPQQVSIITIPCHYGPKLPFHLKRPAVRTILRNGAVFEILYSEALFSNSDQSRRYRQNFMSNAREVIRVTKGRGVIFSSGPGGADAMRSPLDIVNLATVLGMPANLAKDAVSLTPKSVLLNAQARKSYKGVLSQPRLVFPAEEASSEARNAEGIQRRVADAPVREGNAKKRKTAVASSALQVTS